MLRDKADAFEGYNQLHKAPRKPAPILEAACWSHGLRKFVDLVKHGEAPIAHEAVRRIDMLFEIERSISRPFFNRGLATTDTDIRCSWPFDPSLTAAEQS